MKQVEGGIRITVTDLMNAYWCEPPDTSHLDLQREAVDVAVQLYMQNSNVQNSVDDPLKLFETVKKELQPTTFPDRRKKKKKIVQTGNGLIEVEYSDTAADLTVPLIGIVYDESLREFDKLPPDERYLSQANLCTATAMMFALTNDRTSVRYPQVMEVLDRQSAGIRGFLMHKVPVLGLNTDTLHSRWQHGIEQLSQAKTAIPRNPQFHPRLSPAWYAYTHPDNQELYHNHLHNLPYTILYYGTEVSWIEALVSEGVDDGYRRLSSLYRELYNMTRLSALTLEHDIAKMNRIAKGSGSHMSDVLFALADYYRGQINIYGTGGQEAYTNLPDYFDAKKALQKRKKSPRVVPVATMYTPSNVSDLPAISNTDNPDDTFDFLTDVVDIELFEAAAARGEDLEIFAQQREQQPDFGLNFGLSGDDFVSMDGLSLAELEEELNSPDSPLRGQLAGGIAAALEAVLKAKNGEGALEQSGAGIEESVVNAEAATPEPEMNIEIVIDTPKLQLEDDVLIPFMPPVMVHSVPETKKEKLQRQWKNLKHKVRMVIYKRFGV